ncbi:MAG: NAD(+) diphosphatase [Ruminococcaceae bacterium]|nr:NAD(+) diphosphatase [Oscillospiraceae bacterium]
MIQEINSPFFNQYKSTKPEKTDFVLCLKNDAVLCTERDGKLCFPTANELQTVGEYLFSVGSTKYFAGESDEFFDYTYINVRTAANHPDREQAFAAVTGAHLLTWYNDNRFCGRCGKKMHHSTAERAMVCACGNVVYPKICPAVIVAIIHDDRICLTKYNRGYAHWALVAGYAEIGETIEQTVHREVMEEVGIRVKNLRYYKSQPWGRSSSLLLGFFCEADGDALLTVDNNELEEAQWFSPEEIDFEDDKVSLTREMIGIFKSGTYKKLIP